MSITEKESGIVYYWSARKMQPKVVIYVAIVFLAFIVVSYFGFHSISAVKTLALTAVGAIVPLIPMLTSRIEYQLTEQKLEFRAVRKKQNKVYKTLFYLDKLSYVVQISTGFKFYLIFNEPNFIKRFWKKHIIDNYSGEVKIEKADLLNIINKLKDYGITVKSGFINIQTSGKC